MTHLRLSSLNGDEQNQTRDPDKVLVTRIPATGTPLVLPFDPILIISSDRNHRRNIVSIGDTLKLQTEILTNPLASTYTLNLRNAGAAISTNDYSLIVLRIPQTNVFYFRVFTWNAQDTEAQIIVKWNDTMRPFSNGVSFGHLALTYNAQNGKFSGVFDTNTTYGAAEGFGWFSKNDGTDQAKDDLGLYRSPSGPIPIGLPRSVKIGLFITGSNGVTPRQVDFDITSYVANNSATNSETYTMIINKSNEVTFYAGTTEITRDAEEGLYGKSANGTTVNVVNSIERIEDTLYKVPERINIVSCTATVDSWLLTTDNSDGDVQLNVTSAYNPVAARTLTRESPSFTDNNTIITSSDWNSSSMFTIVGSSALTGGSSHEPHRAFNRDTNTFWASGAGTYNSSGAGQQFITIVYPNPVEMRSHRINPGTLLNSGTSAPIQWAISGSNTGGLFTVVDTFSTTAWVDNDFQTFIMHNQTALFKYWRITVTRVTSTGSTTYAILPSVIFDTGIGDTRYMGCCRERRLKNSVLWVVSSIDVWLYQETDHAVGKMQCFVTPSYSLSSLDVFTKDSPTFTNNVNIQSSSDWDNSFGWRLVTSSTFQNNAAFAANAAFDKRIDTWWGSSEGTYNNAGVGSSRYPGTTAPTQWTLQASNDTNFTVLESFSKTNWATNVSVSFPVTVAHEPYRFYRIAVTQLWVTVPGKH
ncbi:hypothetical protein T492DRAFT_840991 [Pavlovales sp. CCMP2436]|nr:hypothetical protein T492DRAFT_840991 [Pavlovales sp. CCMP2436]